MFNLVLGFKLIKNVLCEYLKIISIELIVSLTLIQELEVYIISTDLIVSCTLI